MDFERLGICYLRDYDKYLGICLWLYVRRISQCREAQDRICRKVFFQLFERFPLFVIPLDSQTSLKVGPVLTDLSD